jgi:hypothetical protein
MKATKDSDNEDSDSDDEKQVAPKIVPIVIPNEAKPEPVTAMMAAEKSQSSPPDINKKSRQEGPRGDKQEPESQAVQAERPPENESEYEEFTDGEVEEVSLGSTDDDEAKAKEQALDDPNASTTDYSDLLDNTMVRSLTKRKQGYFTRSASAEKAAAGQAKPRSLTKQGYFTRSASAEKAAAGQAKPRSLTTKKQGYFTRSASAEKSALG